MGDNIVELKQYKDVYYNDIEKRVYIEVSNKSRHYSNYVAKILAEICIPENEYDITFEEYIASIYNRIAQSIPSENSEMKTEIYDESIFVKFTDNTIIEFRHRPGQGTMRPAQIKF